MDEDVVPETTLEVLKGLSGALLDAYVILDTERQIVSFNRVFYSLFPRSVARQLKRITFTEAMSLELSGEKLDLAAECLEHERTLRYDEVKGIIAEEELDVMVGAIPIYDENQTVRGCFIALRNVTDEAQVQVKYRTMLEEEAQAREALQQRITDAEAELVGVKLGLNTIEKELLDYKKGLLV